MSTDSARDIIAIQPRTAEMTEWTVQRVAGALQVLLAARRAARKDEMIQGQSPQHAFAS